MAEKKKGWQRKRRDGREKAEKAGKAERKKGKPKKCSKGRKKDGKAERGEGRKKDRNRRFFIQTN